MARLLRTISGWREHAKGRDPTVSVLQTTAHHPFWDATTGKWVDAADLIPGTSTLVGPDGQLRHVTDVDNHTGAKVMRDLTVATTHTYYVIAGNNPVLVHNNDEESCPIPGAGKDKDGEIFIENDRGDRLYGPYHRISSSTQSDEVADAMRKTGELWGNPARQSLPQPMVQSYRGSLPAGKRGVEFYTPIKPLLPRNSPPGEARWLAGLRGVREENGYAKIPIFIVRDLQR